MNSKGNLKFFSKSTFSYEINTKKVKEISDINDEGFPGKLFEVASLTFNDFLSLKL